MRHAAKPPTSPIMPTAVVQELLTSLAGLGFVCKPLSFEQFEAMMAEVGQQVGLVHGG